MPHADGTPTVEEYLARKRRANLGKSAETAVKNALERLVEKHGTKFDWERNPDTRSVGAQGQILQVRTGDFYAYCGGATASIEVKETTELKLKGAAFKKGQIARGYKRELAGCVCPVVIHFSTADVWMAVPIGYFFNNPVPRGGWDLLNHPNMPKFKTAGEALDWSLTKLLNSLQQ